MYSTMSRDAPAQGNSVAGALVGAAVGAVVGAACLAAASTVAPSNMYTATAVRPAVMSAVPVARQAPLYAGAQNAVQQAAYESQTVVEQAPQNTAVYGWAFGMFAAVAGAVNGLFIMKNRAAMAATTGRREALMAGVAAAGMAASPAFAAYGDAANVFGKPKAVEQVFTISGSGWSGIMPGKYNSSKEVEVPGQVARWEDNFDAVNNSYVVVRDSGKNSITEFGSIDEFRNNVITPLLGKQAFEGQSISEGGFAPGRYSSAAVIDQSQETKDGKTYYFYELLSRTADGNEGGRHQLFVAAASNGKLFIFKQQAGDKRWFKGLERPLRESIAAFRVA